MEKKTWLVQRLREPAQDGLGLGMKDNPFSFGGGLVNGGLSAEAMDLLRNIFAFDYMGAAEFEFGALPKALQRLATHEDLVASSLEVRLKDVSVDFRAPKDAPTPSGWATIYTLCPESWQEEVEARIRLLATGGERLKAPTFLARCLRPYNEWDAETAGWLELDNGFFFFVDADMWRKTCELFDVETSAEIKEETA